MAKYVLKKPIEIGEVKYTELELEAPTLRKLRIHNCAVPNPDLLDEFKFESMYTLICASCTNVPPVELDNLSAADTLGAFTVCTDFLADSSE